MEAIGGLVGLIVLAALYFCPLIVAMSRNHHQTSSIAVINVFLGWTLLGWVIALAMAVGKTDGAGATMQARTAKCSECGGQNPTTAKHCMHCGVTFEGTEAV